MASDGALPTLDQSEIEDIVEEFRSVYSGVSLSSAYVRKSLDGSSSLIVTEWCQPNLERSSITKIQRTLLCDDAFKGGITINTVDISGRALSAEAKSEKFRAVVQTIPDEKNVLKYYLEVWNEEKSLMTLDLTSLDLHGPVYNDELFGSLSWSPHEDKLVYIAEKKSTKTVPFYQQKSKLEPDDQNASSLAGEQYTYDDDWGEQLSPKRQSVIVLCTIADGTIRVLDGLPEDVSPGQVEWDPSGQGIVGITLRHKPVRLGVKFCTNRDCRIFHLSLDGKYTVLSDDSQAAFSPRFSPDGKHLIWLQRPNTGPHMTVLQVVKCNWKTKKVDVLVESVDDFVLTKNGKKFHGVYTFSFPRRCWSSDGKYILLDSDQKYRTNAYAVSVDDGDIWDIGSEQEEESISILDVSHDDYVVGCKTSFNQPTALVSLNLRSTLSAGKSSWSYLTKSVKYEQNVIQPLTVHNSQTKEEQCYGVYFGPTSTVNQSIPLIVLLHGGPHSTITSKYVPRLHLFSNLGFGTLIVHYRGGIGCGKNFVEAALGKIGSADVDDCKAVLQCALQKCSWLDGKKVLVAGGSFGGFLVTHLISQYPNDYVSAVARNPVTNLPAMLYATDIPEWCLVEMRYPYRGMADVIGNVELWKSMTDASPIARIKDVKTPVLLLLGKKDLRVPPFQGLSYYNMLKELNVPAKVHFYDDNHSLSSVVTEMDSTINTIIWFKRCLKKVHL